MVHDNFTVFDDERIRTTARYSIAGFVASVIDISYTTFWVLSAIYGPCSI
jgi:hypothetical protein